MQQNDIVSAVNYDLEVSCSKKSHNTTHFLTRGAIHAHYVNQSSIGN